MKDTFDLDALVVRVIDNHTCEGFSNKEEGGGAERASLRDARVEEERGAALAVGTNATFRRVEMVIENGVPPAYIRAKAKVSECVVEVFPRDRVKGFFPVKRDSKARFISFIQVGLYKVNVMEGFCDDAARHKAELGGGNDGVEDFFDPVSEDFGEDLIVCVKHRKRAVVT